MKSRMKKVLWMMMFALGVCCMSQNVKADDYSSLVSTPPSIYDVSGLKDGKGKITWSAVSMEDDSVIISYDIQVSKNKKFKNAEQYTTNGNFLTLKQSIFGKNGGRFYARVRMVVRVLEDNTTLTSDWSDKKEMVFVKINKTNFPGMYRVLKNGGKRYSMEGNKVETIVYDKNKDGWLDPVEINDIWMIGTVNTSKKVNGVYKITKATNISSFQGVEYFDNLYSVHVARYSGKKADFSKTSVDTVWMTGVTAKQIKVIAPSATSIHVEADISCKMTKMDLTKCSKAVEINAYGNAGTKTLKLPKNKKNLKILSISEMGTKSLNMNAYTKLQQLYVYDSNVKSVKVNKCKNLRYIYFWYCDKIKSLDLKSNKKLRGADFYKTPGLTSATVKKAKNGKYTWNQGKWWYSTSAYKKDMKKIYQ